MLSDRLGRKWVMIIAALLFSISGIWCAASSDFNHLIAARILGGIAIGVVSIVSPSIHIPKLQQHSIEVG